MDLEKYIDFEVEQLVDDAQFRAWVVNGEHAGAWEKLLDDPRFAGKAAEAREMLLFMLKKDEDLLSEEEVKGMWENISRYDRERLRHLHRSRWRRAVAWAASLLLLLALGGIGYYYGIREPREFSFSQAVPDTMHTYARLILPDGEEVLLKRKNSRITLEKNFELILDNDTVIDLSRVVVTGRKNQMNEMVVPYGRSSELYLPDGTRVFLNAGTRFAFPTRFSGKQREVYLNGEAYFEVAKDKEHLFVVNAGEVSVKVLGTHFNVSAYEKDAEIETVLLEGEVTVSRNRDKGFVREKVVLKPYQKASFNRQKNTLKVSEEKDVEDCISWISGWLYFSQKSLPYVFNKVERYYNVRIILPEDFRASSLISGKLDIQGSLEDVMRALSDVGKFSYRIDDHTIYIE